ncbi:unnamed protein product [Ambrosiozyma monospora]|uniref:Unnamed protein product n=1 Tax=Ambrosiozyma monospora TaxID=43982 RepID=A0ACB5TCB3_AMBMO|nr:unnamed protein product [Ambrosiozyma monospora]
MTKIVLLRLSITGEPIVGNTKGVLTFPASPPDPNSKPEDPLFILRFYVVAGSQITNNGTIWVDMPPSHEKLYKRGKFYGHKLESSFYQDTYIDVKIYRPGSYSYYLAYNSLGSDNKETFTTTRKFHFVVPPSLFINGKYLTLNSVSMQSMVSKWMGKDDKDWQLLFSEVAKKGYNMIHFTPLQHRGESNSPYSIYDQLEFDPAVFKSVDDVKKMIKDLESQHDCPTFDFCH